MTAECPCRSRQRRDDPSGEAQQVHDSRIHRFPAIRGDLCVVARHKRQPLPPRPLPRGASSSKRSQSSRAGDVRIGWGGNDGRVWRRSGYSHGGGHAAKATDRPLAASALQWQALSAISSSTSGIDGGPAMEPVHSGFLQTALIGKAAPRTTPLSKVGSLGLVLADSKRPVRASGVSRQAP